MTKYLGIFLLVVSFIAHAEIPQNFSFKGNQAVFVDFISANYSIRYDAKAEKAVATSTIKFYQRNSGYAIFDLVPFAYNVRIDGKGTDVYEVTAPYSVTKFKTLGTVTGVGYHTVTMQNEIDTNITYSHGGVQSAFWMSDLREREFLEQYLPSNFEYDRYQMELNLEFVNQSATQYVYSNGSIQVVGRNQFKITFPDHFTTASMYFHTTTLGRFYHRNFTYRSRSGKDIPITIYSRYSSNVWNAQRETFKVLAELENNFGNWPHPKLIIYVAGYGGMEHCGATITSLSALGHELTHSYFARGVFPFNGNAGWIDEGIATWRGDKYFSVSQPNFSWSRMGNHSNYRRSTDRDAYTKGANFMAYVNNQLQHKGGLVRFLNHLFHKYLFQSITNEIFKNELEAFSGISFDWDFNKYVYGLGGRKDDHAHKDDERTKHNPFHPQLTKKQLKDLL